MFCRDRREVFVWILSGASITKSVSLSRQILSEVLFHDFMILGVFHSAFSTNHIMDLMEWQHAAKVFLGYIDPNAPDQISLLSMRTIFLSGCRCTFGVTITVLLKRNLVLYACVSIPAPRPADWRERLAPLCWLAESNRLPRDSHMSSRLTRIVHDTFLRYLGNLPYSLSPPPPPPDPRHHHRQRLFLFPSLPNPQPSPT